MRAGQTATKGCWCNKAERLEASRDVIPALLVIALFRPSLSLFAGSARTFCVLMLDPGSPRLSDMLAAFLEYFWVGRNSHGFHTFLSDPHLVERKAL